MKLYDFTFAPSPRRVRIFMAEKDITIPTEQVDLMTGAQFSDAYRAVNPRCAVPCLVLDDGTAISEVPAIWQYLEAVHPDPPLLGTDAASRATITMWDRRVELDGYHAAAEAFRNKAEPFATHAVVGPHDYPQIAGLVGRGEARTRDFYADLDARLAASPFVAGDAFTGADITAIVTVDFSVADAGIAIPDELEALRAWRAKVSARPSMAA